MPDFECNNFQILPNSFCSGLEDENPADPELEIRVRDTLPKDRPAIEPKNKDSWTLSGREAEALHMEEEDGGGGDSDDSGSNDSSNVDPLTKLLQSG